MRKSKKSQSARPAAPAPTPLTPDHPLVKGFAEIFFQIEHELILSEGNAGKLARALVRMKRAGKSAEEIRPYAAPFLRDVEKWASTPIEKLKTATAGKVLIDFNITK